MKYAPKDIKSKIVKVDGLNSYIKRLNDESRNENMSDKQMKELADFFLQSSIPNTTDYTAKYQLEVNEEKTKSQFKTHILTALKIHLYIKH